jgi:hypothetical protein
MTIIALATFERAAKRAGLTARERETFIICSNTTRVPAN